MNLSDMMEGLKKAQEHNTRFCGIQLTQAEIAPILAEYAEIKRLALALSEFADWLDTQRPSAVQIKVSPDYNAAVVQTLEWVAKQARAKAREARG